MFEQIGVSLRRFLQFLPAGVIVICVALLLAWAVSRRSHPVQTLPAGQLGSGLSRPAPERRRSAHPTTEVPPVPPGIVGRLSAQKILKYGHGEGELGMVTKKDQPPVGPESFAIGRDGGILVADVVNQRVLVYSRDGAYRRSIRVPGIMLGDVTADDSGRVYVYDQGRRALLQYDEDGTPRSELSLSPADIDTRGYFHLVKNSVYFADAAARDVLVATVRDGHLTPPEASLERTTDGIHSESGRIYSMAVDKGQALRLEVRDPAAQSVPRTLELPLPGIVSARYAGEDQARRFYVQTERLAAATIVLEVLAFNPGGELLGATRMPENDYAIWTAKLVDVRADGTIVQFLPQHDQAQLNLFAN